jgi:hypothetical protein
MICQNTLNKKTTESVICFVIQSECRQANPEKRNRRHRISDQRLKYYEMQLESVGEESKPCSCRIHIGGHGDPIELNK